ncbi:CHAT domain-containing protein [Tolypothrix sp. FACHB-123]|uniref:CHAT domain-containing protein n=1 Tax=Tolypothrix sp. FACHB-123 TaxID=2692868 RepID=UPI0016886F97|nr:CHAT domain-containing tetratricopeptide repeat protein [Tolypothrix sp. FACHB-123]MBD2356680.1 CHAT domain-containing protein [Tolypothrix sp. FACHB-123]
MKIQKIALITFITLLATIGQTPINRSAIVGITQASAQTPEARKAEAERLMKQGIQEYRKRQFPAAIQSWQQALIIYQEIKDRQGEYEVQGSLGFAYYNLRNYPKVIEHHSSSLAIAREIQNSKDERLFLDSLGFAYYALGNYPKAIEYYQQSLAIARKSQDPQSEENALGGIGLAYYYLGDYPKAIEYHSLSLAIARKLKDRQSQGKSLGNLGLAYHALGDYKKAIDYQQQRLAIAREIKDSLGEGQSLGNLGLAYRALGDYPKAIEYHQQSLVVFQKIKDLLGEGRALGNLGSIYHALGDYPKAIEYYSSSLVILRKIKNRQGEAQSLGNIGSVYYAVGNYPKAIEYHQQSLVVFQAMKDRLGEGRALSNLGLAYDALEEYPKSINYYSSSLAIFKEIKNRPGEGAALGSLGNAYYALGDYKKAIDYQKQSLAIKRAINDRAGEGISLNNLGIAFYKQGNLSDAEKVLYEGIKVWESLRDKKLADTNKVSLFDTQRITYIVLQKVLIAQNKTDAALEIAERGRARAFVELLASRLSTNNKQTDKSSSSPTIDQIKQIAQQQNATLVQYSITSDQFLVAGKQKYKTSDLYIWVIKPNGEVTFRKVDLKSLWQKDNTSLEELVTQSRVGIGAGRGRGGIIARQNPDAANVKKPLQKLYDILIKDIADLLPKNPEDRVIFIPQDSLFLAPFPALLDAKGKYLIEKHTILTAPAIQVLDFTHQLKRGRQTNYNNALIVGNPIMPVVSTEPGKPATKLDPLPGAELEAKTIAQMLKTQAILGKDATKANILSRLSSADVIHLATHGWADDYRGLGSWIALAPSSNDDGLLKAEEILDLKLKAQLVVLSACETGKGKLSGDGVIGLSRSLISAGVPSVLVSLWQVPDQPTQYLMVEFYKSLQTQPDKALALRQAMLNTKEKFPSAGDWAAFTLIGER